MPAELSARIGERARFPNMSWVKQGLNGKEDGGNDPESMQYVNGKKWKQESAYDSDASSVADDPPSLLTRLRSPPDRSESPMAISPVSPKSLLERVGERSPAKTKPFIASRFSLDRASGRHEQPSQASADQTVRPTNRLSAGNSHLTSAHPDRQKASSELGDVQGLQAHSANETQAPKAQTEEFEVPGLSVTSFPQPFPRPTSSNDSEDYDGTIPGLSLTVPAPGQGTSALLSPITPNVMCSSAQKQGSGLQIEEPVPSSNIAQDQLLGRVRDLLTPLILENAILRDSSQQQDSIHDRKDLAGKTQVVLGDNEACLSIVKNAIHVHQALIEADMIKAAEYFVIPGQTALSGDRVETVASDSNAMASLPLKRVQEAFDQLVGRSPVSSPTDNMPPSVPKAMRVGSPSQADPETRKNTRGDLARAGPEFGDARRSGRSRSRSLPRWQRPPDPGQLEMRRSRSSTRLRRSASTCRHMSPRKVKSPRSPSSWARHRPAGSGSPRRYSYSKRVSPPPHTPLGSASARFPRGVGSSKYRERRGYRSRSTSFSDDRYPRRKRASYTPPPRKTEDTKWDRKRSPSPALQRRRSRYDARAQSRSRDDATRRHRNRSSRSRSRGEGSSRWKLRGRPSSLRRSTSRGRGDTRLQHPPRERNDGHTQARNAYHSVVHASLPSTPPAPNPPKVASAEDSAEIQEDSLLFRVGDYNRDSTKEPGQISSSPSKETDTFVLRLTASSSLANEIPGLTLNVKPKPPSALQPTEEDKLNSAELERQRIECRNNILNEPSSSTAVNATQQPPGVATPVLVDNVGIYFKHQVPQASAQVTNEGEEEGAGGKRESGATLQGRKRIRSPRFEAEQVEDRDQHNKERGKALEAEREQSLHKLQLHAPGRDNFDGLETKSEAEVLQPGPHVLQAKDKEEEEGIPMVEAPQPVESPAPPPMSKPPSHFVPGVWYIQTGSKGFDTANCSFLIDEFTADKWGLAHHNPEKSGSLDVQVRCFPSKEMWERMKSLPQDATLGEIAEALAELPQSWPPRNESPLITLHPGKPNERVWLPGQMPSNDPNENFRTIQLERHLQVGDNLLRIIQLSDLSAFTFVIFASERSTSGLDHFLGRASREIP